MLGGDTWLKLWRKTVDWEWWKDPVVAHLFIHCLFRANIEKSYFKGIPVPVGSFVASYSGLSEETGLTYDQVRRGVKVLTNCGTITRTTHGKYSVFSVVKWDSYQGHIPSKSQTNPNHIPSKSQRNKNTKEYIEEKEEKERISALSSDESNEEVVWEYEPGD